MDLLSRIASWLGENEATISAVVGITVLAGVIFAGLRSLLHRAADKSEAKTPGGNAETHPATDSASPGRDSPPISDSDQHPSVSGTARTDTEPGYRTGLASIQSAAPMSDTDRQARLLLLVFTDLEGSTALKSKIGDKAAGALISQHQAHVRRLLSETGGREIDCALDDFFLTFDSPSAAATFALRLQQIHHTETDLPAVRFGIHLGEVTERLAPPGSTKPVLVEGLAVDLAAGIQALAQLQGGR
jgi:hypothetical protein